MLRLGIRLDRLLRCYATADTCNELKPFAFFMACIGLTFMLALVLVLALGLALSLPRGVRLTFQRRTKVRVADAGLIPSNSSVRAVHQINLARRMACG